MDRFTGWPEVIPTSANAGCPVSIITDQGRNFESVFLRELTNILGCNRIHATAHPPTSNGMAERFHCFLKTPITTYDNTNWTETLSLVLVDLLTAIKSDIQARSAELVCGTTLRLPADLCTADNCKNLLIRRMCDRFVN